MQKIEYKYEDSFMEIKVNAGPEESFEINGGELMMLINRLQNLLSTANKFEVIIKSKEFGVDE